VLFVNVPIGVLLAALAPLYVTESERQPGRFDLAGALTSTAGMTALVYGFIRAAQDGWSNPATLGSFTAAAVLLATFLSIETRIRQPITPLHLFADRDRAGSHAVMLALSAAMIGQFFFLTLFVQDVLGYSSLRAGFAFLPITAAIITSSQFAARSLPRIGPKRLMTAGALFGVVGLAWLTQVSVTSGYLDGVLGPMLVFGLGMGLLFVPLTIIAVSGVPPHETGAASSLLNVMQQIGGSLGLSILVTVFGTASRTEATRLVGQFLATPPPGSPIPVPADRPALSPLRRPGPRPRHLDLVPARSRVRRPCPRRRLGRRPRAHSAGGAGRVLVDRRNGSRSHAVGWRCSPEDANPGPLGDLLPGVSAHAFASIAWCIRAGVACSHRALPGFRTRVPQLGSCVVHESGR
jgi:Major Facilitator Superfamily